MTDLKSRLCERRTTSCLVIEWCHLSRVWLRLWNVWRGSEERAFMYVSCSFLDGLVGQTGDHADTRWETTDALKMYFILFGGSYLPPWFIQPTCTSAANLMNVFSPSHLPKSTAVRWQYAACCLWPENFDVTPHGFPKGTSSNAHSKCKYNKCFPRFGYAPVDNCQLTKDNWQLPMLPLFERAFGFFCSGSICVLSLICHNWQKRLFFHFTLIVIESFHWTDIKFAK